MILKPYIISIISILLISCVDPFKDGNKTKWENFETRIIRSVIDGGGIGCSSGHIYIQSVKYPEDISRVIYLGTNSGTCFNFVGDSVIFSVFGGDSYNKIDSDKDVFGRIIKLKPVLSIPFDSSKYAGCI